MGTGAVYVALEGLKEHYGSSLAVLVDVFFFLNLVLFILNNTTLFLQFICKRSAEKHRLSSDSPSGTQCTLDRQSD